MSQTPQSTSSSFLPRFSFFPIRLSLPNESTSDIYINGLPPNSAGLWTFPGVQGQNISFMLLPKVATRFMFQQYIKLSCTLSDFAYAHNHDTGLYTVNFQNQDFN